MQDPFDNEGEEQSLDDINAENEIKKIKLALEHGMDLSKSLENSAMPPELESKFLDYVQQWEDEFAKGKMIKIYDFVGTPEWTPVADLADEQVTAELERIAGLLQNNGIRVESICDVEDREMYRFITEELFQVETNDIRIERMMHCFIYEEYHPNHVYDVKNRCNELLEYITNKERETNAEPWGLAAKVVSCGKKMPKEEVIQKLDNFRNAFSSFTVNEFEFGLIYMNDRNDDAELLVDIDYAGVIDGSNDIIEFKGECRFILLRSDDWWEIVRFEIPGVAM